MTAAIAARMVILLPQPWESVGRGLTLHSVVVSDDDMPAPTDRRVAFDNPLDRRGRRHSDTGTRHSGGSQQGSASVKNRAVDETDMRSTPTAILELIGRSRSKSAIAEMARKILRERTVTSVAAALATKPDAVAPQASDERDIQRSGAQTAARAERKVAQADDQAAPVQEPTRKPVRKAVENGRRHLTEAVKGVAKKAASPVKQVRAKKMPTPESIRATRLRYIRKMMRSPGGLHIVGVVTYDH